MLDQRLGGKTPRCRPACLEELFIGQHFVMKKSKFTEEHISFALRQAESNTNVALVYRKMGISNAIYYNRKKKTESRGEDAASLDAQMRLAMGDKTIPLNFSSATLIAYMIR